MKYTALAHWEGSLKKGKGTLSTQSGALKNAKYSYKSRFEDPEDGTNPEELLAASLAGCFTMAVCSHLTKKGYDPTELDTKAIASMEDLTVNEIHLSITGKVQDLSDQDFADVTRYEGQHCIIAKALKVTINTEARLVA